MKKEHFYFLLCSLVLYMFTVNTIRIGDTILLFPENIFQLILSNILHHKSVIQVYY